MDSDSDSGTPLASFEAKWSAAHPEFGLALKFVAARERAAQGAFACLVFELEQAAFATPDAEPAAIKLQWWAEELTRAGRGEARHPLTRELAGRREFVAVPIAQWRDVVAGAFAQRDRAPAADGAAVLDRYAGIDTGRNRLRARRQHEQQRRQLHGAPAGRANNTYSPTDGPCEYTRISSVVTTGTASPSTAAK